MKCESRSALDCIEEIVLGKLECQAARPFNSFTPEFKKVHSPNLLEGRCISEVVRIGSTIIVHPSKL